jgi:hypothetical protein
MQKQVTSEVAVALYGGERRHRIALHRLNVTYAWLPPFEGASKTIPNRLEVVFSRHRRVAIEQAGTTLDVDVAAGGFYVVGPEPTTLLRVPEFSDTLEMYPDTALLETAAAENGQSGFALHPTLGKDPSPRIAADRTMLALSHVLRQACLGQRTLSPIEASTLEHLLAAPRRRQRRLAAWRWQTAPNIIEARAGPHRGRTRPTLDLGRACRRGLPERLPFRPIIQEVYRPGAAQIRPRAQD